MNLNTIRADVNAMRKHLDHQFTLLREAGEMLYRIEERLMDEEDRIFNERFVKGSIEFLETAAKNMSLADNGFLGGCAGYSTHIDPFFEDKKIV